MKHVVKISIAMILLIQSMAFSQKTEPVTTSQTNEAITNVESTETKISTDNAKRFIGKYFLEEADFELEIVQEDENNMYLISPFSKDILFIKNETTVQELTRGVSLELIEGNPDGLKFTQNGYETIIKRVKPETQN